ncbi:RF-1 domain-containing protein [Lipomyces chichibuensis]|uniref:RF-1 domain-containing protein n=1 Tax=Lipomyces chichibuensis TaxID=1546026 RepID=UPI0033441F2D
MIISIIAWPATLVSVKSASKPLLLCFTNRWVTSHNGNSHLRFAGIIQHNKQTFSSTTLRCKKNALPPRTTIPEDEIEEVFIKGGGKGGQKINKTNSKVQLRHIPTGFVVSSQATRSREQNRKLARIELAEELEYLRDPENSRRGQKIKQLQKKKAQQRKKAIRRDKERHVGLIDEVKSSLDELYGEVLLQATVKEQKHLGPGTPEKNSAGSEVTLTSAVPEDMKDAAELEVKCNLMRRKDNKSRDDNGRK